MKFRDVVVVVFAGKECIEPDDYSDDYYDYWTFEDISETKQKLINALASIHVTCVDTDIVIKWESVKDGTRACEFRCEYTPTEEETIYLNKHKFLDLYVYGHLTPFYWNASNPNRSLEVSLRLEE
jgi:hypothetical protein